MQGMNRSRPRWGLPFESTQNQSVSVINSSAAPQNPSEPERRFHRREQREGVRQLNRDRQKLRRLCKGYLVG
jgi:hypothetical protein